MNSLLGNRNTRNLLLQGAFALCIVVVIAAALVITRQNLTRQGMALGWGFLDQTTGWTISFSAIPYDIDDTYKRALLAGLVNTILLGTVSVAIATVLGTVVGTARLSQHKMVNLLASAYVQLFRNIPLILQAFFWYTLATNLPPPRSAIAVPGGLFLSSRGVFFPLLNVEWLFLSLSAIIALGGLGLGLVQARRGRRSVAGLVALATLILAACALVAGRLPDHALVDVPTLRGLRFEGGMAISPEVSAAIVSISLFGAAYVAEVIRAGFQAVPVGLNEAGSALGLRKTHIFWRIRLPLAIRLMMPTMTNLVVWLMKATTIGIAIGFFDFFAVVATSINHSGQTIPLIIILVVGFWAINLTISFVMSAVNRSIAIPGFR